MPDIICLKTVNTSEEALTAKDLLVTNGIETKIVYQGHGRMPIPFALPVIAEIKLMVKEEDKASAESLLKKHNA